MQTYNSSTIIVYRRNKLKFNLGWNSKCICFKHNNHCNCCLFVSKKFLGQYKKYWYNYQLLFYSFTHLFYSLHPPISLCPSQVQYRPPCNQNFKRIQLGLAHKISIISHNYITTQGQIYFRTYLSTYLFTNLDKNTSFFFLHPNG